MSPATDLDTLAVRRDLRRLAEEQRQLKRSTRRSGYQITRAVAAELESRRSRLTMLCVLVAHARGRVHLRGASLAEQETWIEARFQSWGMQDYLITHMAAA